MNNTWKGVALTLILLLVVFFVFNIFRDNSSQSSYQTQSKTYEEYLEKQSQAYNESLSKANEQTERAKQLNDKVAEHQQRYEKLLDRWEAQADKMDVILLKLEK